MDILEQYARFDLLHVQELVTHLRTPQVGHARVDGDFLVERLSRGITARRRQFKYRKLRKAVFDPSPLEIC